MNEERFLTKTEFDTIRQIERLEHQLGVLMNENSELIKTNAVRLKEHDKEYERAENLLAENNKLKKLLSPMQRRKFRFQNN